MKRWLPLRILDCLLLGAVSTVLTAWAFAVWAPGAPRGTPTFGSEVRYVYDPAVGTWMFTIERHLGRMDVISGRVMPPNDNLALRAPDPDRLVDQSSVPGWSAMRTEGAPMETEIAPIPTITKRVYHEYAYGFPLPALVERHQTTGRAETNKPWLLPGSLRNVGPGDTVPIRPLPLGMIIDIGVHALLWTIPLMLLGSGRRMMRTARGRCQKCGYDLRASKSGVCPECGHQVVRRSD